MESENIENRIAWWNEISAGVGLILGYIVYGVYWVLTPETHVEIEYTEPEYADVIVGKIPNNFSYKSAPHLPEILSRELEREVTVSAPVFDDKGRPKLIVKKLEASGLGDSRVIATKEEILIPVLSDHSFTYLVVEDRKLIKYYPSVSYKGTGVYYEKKEVIFEDANIADSFAVRTATFFALLSFMLFCLKSRHNVIQWIKSLLRTKFEQQEDYYD
ncbi:hypothetical protein [Marinomonas mediterranea]|jgi:hypothetical protein|uniref:Uncharacterized protein n=1 Tax=Marinomonas mediterranea (strain ATCC 700492 / JCM 21426 / NBRC 103028 / MMB-1) TaxID=717774 RepID=F2K237_MARM1|nr:hypothetical protein [Marinomonas mediterranea]ADZ91115.1 hypothetical protein Marme_1859 [Marinomonas mediterranea MMB-1]WCN17247.1 hypothetical protein GV053_09385 [Marinomonas mediterranea MMB-1]